MVKDGMNVEDMKTCKEKENVLFHLCFKHVNEQLFALSREDAASPKLDELRSVLRFLEDNSDSHTETVKRVMLESIAQYIEEDDEHLVESVAESLIRAFNILFDENMLPTVYAAYMDIAVKLTTDIRMANGGSKWVEIEATNIQELEQGTFSIELNGWQTNYCGYDETEQWIATVTGVYGEAKAIHVSVTFGDERAKTDDFAQTVIAMCTNNLKEQMSEMKTNS